MMHSQLISKPNYVTNSKRDDGFGGQFQQLIWTIVWAETNGINFLYTDIDHIAHINNTEGEHTLEEVIDYMALKKNYQNISTFPFSAKTLTHEHVYPHVEPNINYFFSNTNASFSKYKELFYRGKSSRFNKEKFNVAVHIRRPNFTDVRIEGTDTPLGLYLLIMNYIRNKYNDKNILFHIHSQGNADDFSILKSEDVIFHLNERTLDAFTDFVFADALVLSRSSFSYTAAFLSSGDIYYIPFWHIPMQHWNVCIENT